MMPRSPTRTSWPRRIATACWIGTALSGFAMAGLYLFRSDFMPYHRDALGLAWGALETELQALLLALVRVAGGGFLAVSLGVLIVALGPFRRREPWASVVLPALVVGFYGPTLWATLIVATRTPAEPPYIGPALGLTAAAAGTALDLWDRAARR